MCATKYKKNIHRVSHYAESIPLNATVNGQDLSSQYSISVLRWHSRLASRLIGFPFWGRMPRGTWDMPVLVKNFSGHGQRIWDYIPALPHKCAYSASIPLNATLSGQDLSSQCSIFIPHWLASCLIGFPFQDICHVAPGSRLRWPKKIRGRGQRIWV